MSGLDSILGNPKEMTEDQFKEEIIPVVHGILKREFPDNTRKQNIKSYPDRLNFSCPLCGDSSHDDNKKRGNIILRGQFKNMYKCHNCGIAMPLKKFFDKFGHMGDISSSATMYLHTNRQEYSADASLAKNTDLLIEIQEIEKLAVDREQLKFKMGLCECTEFCKGREYLVKRSQFDFKRFLYSRHRNELYVLNLTPDGKIFALQIRDLNPESRGPKYRTFCLSNIYKTFFGVEDVEVYTKYDSLSMLFNVLMVDYSRDVYVTEGPMDSFLIRNCIAACGGSKKIPLDMELLYLYDYDAPGTKYAMEALNEGRKVFLWRKFAAAIGLPSRKKWDYNDLVLYCKENDIKIPNIKDFFSDDPLDVMFL